MRASFLAALFAITELVRAISFQASALPAPCVNPRVPSSILTSPQTSKSYYGRLSTAHIMVGNRSISLAVAKRIPDLEEGLMCVSKMKSNAGMLFVFENPQVLEFWMKDTHIPLDILWLDQFGRVKSLAVNVPAPKIGEEPARRSGYGKYVIELNAGAVAAFKIKIGSSLSVGGI